MHHVIYKKDDNTKNKQKCGGGIAEKKEKKSINWFKLN